MQSPQDDPKPVGRPSKYTPEIAAEILNRLAGGESLRSICRDSNIPSHVTVHAWLNTDEDFLNLYRRARDIQADWRYDEVYDLPFECEQSGLDVAYTKLKMDGAKWSASKGNPTKYGDKSSTEITGAGGKDLVPETNLDDFARRMAFVFAKALATKNSGEPG